MFNLPAQGFEAHTLRTASDVTLDDRASHIHRRFFSMDLEISQFADPTFVAEVLALLQIWFSATFLPRRCNARSCKKHEMALRTSKGTQSTRTWNGSVTAGTGQSRAASDSIGGLLLCGIFEKQDPFVSVQSEAIIAAVLSASQSTDL